MTPPLYRHIERAYKEHRRTIAGRLRALGVFTPDVPDLVQGVFLVALRHADKLPREAEDEKAWLLAVARKLAANWRRCYRHAREVKDDEASAAALGEPEDPEGVRAIEHLVRAVLGRMTPEDREVLVLRELGGASWKTIAVRMGWSRSYAHQRGVTARKRFVEVLASYGLDEPSRLS
jgi:RNA polymerase sigma factor (sigma-70 family)